MSESGEKSEMGFGEALARQTAARQNRAQALETALRSPDPASFNRLLAGSEESLWEHARDFFRDRRLEMDGLARGGAEMAKRFARLCAHPGLQLKLSEGDLPIRGLFDNGGEGGDRMSMLDAAARILLQLSHRAETAQEAGTALSTALGNPGIDSAQRANLCSRILREPLYAGQTWSAAFSRALKELEPGAKGAAMGLFERLGQKMAWAEPGSGEFRGLKELFEIGAPFPYASVKAACRQQTLRSSMTDPERVANWARQTKEMRVVDAKMAERLLSEGAVGGALKAWMEALALEAGVSSAPKRPGSAL